MKPRRAASCARCGKAGRPRQLDELLKHNRDAPITVLCNRCVQICLIWVEGLAANSRCSQALAESLDISDVPVSQEPPRARAEA
jgi:hypothetical protein